jgi:hypothetical protein
MLRYSLGVRNYEQGWGVMEGWRVKKRRRINWRSKDTLDKTRPGQSYLDGWRSEEDKELQANNGW